MADTLWKASERKIAHQFGTERTGPQGCNIPDVITSVYSIEVKTRKAIPAWLHAAMTQSERNAVAGTVPVVVLHQVGTRYDNDLVIMQMKDFHQWNHEFGEDEDDLGF